MKNHEELRKMNILDRLRKLASGEIEGEIKQIEYSLAADKIKLLQSDNRDLTKCNFELHNARNYADELMDANGFSSLTELLMETKRLQSDIIEKSDEFVNFVQIDHPEALAKRDETILQLQADNEKLREALKTIETLGWQTSDDYSRTCEGLSAIAKEALGKDE